MIRAILLASATATTLCGFARFKLGMWIPANRGRMADIEKKTKRYPSNLRDVEWRRVALLLPKPAKCSRKPSADLRDVLNAIRYMARSGAGWRMLLKESCPGRWCEPRKLIQK